MYLKAHHFLIPKLIASTATVSRNAVIGEGMLIMSQANVGACNIGDFCIIAQSSNINADSVVSDYGRLWCYCIPWSDTW